MIFPFLQTVNLLYRKKLNDNYIIEEGSNANGHYRKWSNGTLDMWGNIVQGSTLINTAQGSCFSSAAQLLTLPQTSVANVTGVELEFVSNRIAWATQGTGRNSKNTIGYFLVCPASVTASGALHFRCTGTWK